MLLSLFSSRYISTPTQAIAEGLRSYIQDFQARTRADKPAATPPAPPLRSAAAVQLNHGPDNRELGTAPRISFVPLQDFLMPDWYPRAVEALAEGTAGSYFGIFAMKCQQVDKARCVPSRPVHCRPPLRCGPLVAWCGAKRATATGRLTGWPSLSDHLCLCRRCRRTSQRTHEQMKKDLDIFRDLFEEALGVDPKRTDSKMRVDKIFRQLTGARGRRHTRQASHAATRCAFCQRHGTANASAAAQSRHCGQMSTTLPARWTRKSSWRAGTTS